MKKLLTLGHPSVSGSLDELGATWVAAFFGVVLIVAAAIWAAISVA